MDFKESWMKNLIVGDKSTVQPLAERRKQASAHSQYQRIQCVLGSSVRRAPRLAQDRAASKAPEGECCGAACL